MQRFLQVHTSMCRFKSITRAWFRVTLVKVKVTSTLKGLCKFQATSACILKLIHVVHTAVLCESESAHASVRVTE